MNKILWSILFLGIHILFNLYGYLLTALYSAHRYFSQTPHANSRKKRVVIVGGGFAGAYVAKELQDYFSVTLIDNKEYFEFTPSVLRTLVQPSHRHKIQLRHEYYLDPLKATFIQKKAETITPTSVILEDGKKVQFDILVVSVGSEYHVPFKESNVFLSSRTHHLHAAHKQLDNSNSMLVIGGGLVGIELAAELAQKYTGKQITLVHGGETLMNNSQTTPSAIKYCEEYLKKQGVRILLDELVVKQEGNIFTTNKGTAIEADTAFLCTGIKPNNQLLKNSFSGCLNAEGFAVVNKQLQLIGHPNIFVAGDIAATGDEKLAQSAEAQAHTVVKNVMLFSQGKPLKVYSAAERPKVISLGKYDGVFVYKWITLKGLIPALMKEFVECKVMTAYKSHHSNKSVKLLNKHHVVFNKN